MVDYNYIIYIITTVLGILLGLVIRDIYSFVKHKIRYGTETTKTPITVQFSSIAEGEEEFLKLKYYLLLVKHGKDEVIKDPEKLLNKEIKFEGYNPKIAKLRVHKILGAQFKCFVDYENEDQFDRIKNFLEKNGFSEVSHDDARMKKRAWFIHPKYSTCRTEDEYINNFTHPPTYEKG
ncbi:MAG: hypothetical protein FJW63_08960 [Actinobacteria bacterium]|nr:hypothetical protein [Actinomycetota bacterium]